MPHDALVRLPLWVLEVIAVHLQRVRRAKVRMMQ
jgi:hypothetical protein